MIFPLRVFGSPGAMCTTSGAANDPITCRTCSLSAPSSSFARPCLAEVGREHHVSVDALALDVVREADDRGFARSRGRQALDLGSNT